MVYHAGIIPHHQELTLYNSVTRENKSYTIKKVDENDIDEVEDLFTCIKDKINDRETFGCVCIWLTPNYSQEIRKRFFECAQNYGFTNVEIIDNITTLYFDAISQSEYIPKLNDIIWIFHGCCYVWQMDTTKARFIKEVSCNYSTEKGLMQIKKDSQMYSDPSIIMYYRYNKLNKKIVERLFQECELISFNKRKTAEQCVIKARIMAKDPKVICIDAEIVGNKNIPNFVDKTNRISYPVQQSMVKLENKKTLIKEIWANKENVEYPIFRTVINNIYEIQRLLFSQGAYSRDIPYSCFNDDGINTHVTLTKPKPPPKKLTPTEFFTKSKPGIQSFKTYIIPKIDVTANNEIYAVGMDLGTTRCCCAINRINGIECIDIDNKGEKKMASYVSFESENPICGNVVLKNIRNRIKSTIYDSKRIIGKQLEEINIDPKWIFLVNEKDDKVVIQIQDKNQETLQKSPETVAAVLIKHMKKKAKLKHEHEIEKAVVITVPAAFTMEQKEATLKATKLAGLNQVYLLPEPVAATIAYLIKKPILKASNVLLVDLGGGTLDICLVRVDETQIEIIKTIGNNSLGGEDFDNILFFYFADILEKNFNININNINEKMKYLLLAECAELKHSLSVTEEEDFYVDVLDPTMEGQIPITRKEFEDMSKHLIKEIKNAINNVFSNLSQEYEKLDKILMVGGGCRMPMVIKLLNEMFPNVQKCCEQDPDQSVAIGAAYYSYYLQVFNVKICKDCREEVCKCIKKI